MFENATTIHFQPGRLDQALALLRSEIVPVLKSHEGFINLCLLPHSADNAITVISIWSCRTHAIAVEAACTYRRGIDRLHAMLAEGEAKVPGHRAAPRSAIGKPPIN
ncbi:MAG: hypothetical protein M1140_03085 [Chloroflexi bacterium]|nr:hypothetical protein [Chloroflexota bacterium]